MEAFEQRKGKEEAARAQQQWLEQVHNRRFQSLDMMRAIQSLLPRDEGKEVPENPADRLELHIERMECQYFPELATWFEDVKQQWTETHVVEEAAAEDEDGDEDEEASSDAADEPGAEGGAAADNPDEAALAGQADKKSENAVPKGAGWVIELTGFHLRNEDRHKPSEGAQFLRDTLIKNLMSEGKKVIVSAGPLHGEEVSVSELGIGFPVIVKSSPVAKKRYDFVVQFCWQPRPAGQPLSPPPAPPPAEAAE
jgi:hypothetical protein